MKVTFVLPTSNRIAVTYVRNGVNYVANIENPRNHDGLVVALLARKVGISQVVSIKPA